MNLIINGEERRVEASTMQQLIEHMGLAGKLIVAEADGVIIDQSEWENAELRDGMKIELVHFVGGG